MSDDWESWGMMGTGEGICLLSESGYTTKTQIFTFYKISIIAEEKSDSDHLI